MSVRLAGLVLVTVAACGPRPPPTSTPAAAPAPAPDAGPPPPTRVTEEPAKDPLATAVERFVTLYEAIATVPAGTPCRDAAASIDRWITERAAALAQVHDAAQGRQAELVDGLFHDASPRLAAAMTAIDGHAARCAKEPAFGAALTRLSTEAGR